METRANFLLIGGFTLLTLVGAAFFAVWLGQMRLNQQSDLYEILFEGNVSGLSVGSDVQVNGIPVGEVLRIALDRDDPQIVRVEVELAQEVPVKADAKASLELQGVTGLAIIQINAGSAQTALLRDVAPQAVPQIPSVRSPIQELVASAPVLIAEATLAFRQVSAFASEENIQSLSQSLENVAVLTEGLAESSGDLSTILENFASASGELQTSLEQTTATLTRAEELLVGIDGLVGTEGRALLGELSNSADSLSALAQTTETVLGENREAFRTFSSQGLTEFTSFVAEARQLVITLDRLAGKIESDPRAFFLGSRTREFDPQ